MPNQVQYPASTGFVKINPTIANAIVTKFEVSGGYKEMEAIPDETGVPSVYNGVNLEYEYDIEVMPKTGFAAPVMLTKLIFIAPTQTNAIPIPGTVSGDINVLITSPIEISRTDNGKIGKYAFKGITNANVP